MALTKIDDRGLKTPIDLLDSESIRLGTGNDLQLYANGSNSYIQHSGDGDFYVQTGQTDEDLYLIAGSSVFIKPTGGADHGIKVLKNGGVELYHDNSKKLETTSGGVNVTGSLICQDTGEYQVVLKDSNNTGNAAEAAIGFKGNDDAVLGLVGMNYWGDGNLDIQNNLSGGTISFETHNGTAVGERMRIDSSGRVGIGTSALSSYNGSGDDLVIDNGAADVGITLDSETQCGIAFTDSAKTGWDGWIKYVHSDNHLEFAANSSPRLTINSSGHISMGAATAPLTSYHGNTGTLFTVYDPNANAGVIEIAGDNNTNGYNAGSLAFINNNNSDGSTPWSAGSKYVALIRAQLYTSDSNAGDDSGADLVFYRKNEAAAGTEGMRIKHNGDVSLANGNLIVASGKGIDFSATSDATGKTSELLDEYEEGTFTPVITGATHSDLGSYGRYVRVGKLVTISVRIQISASAVSGGVTVTGLPFTPITGTGENYTSGGITYYDMPSSITNFDPYIASGNSTIYFFEKGSGTQLTFSSTFTAKYLGFSAMYYV